MSRTHQGIDTTRPEDVVAAPADRGAQLDSILRTAALPIVCTDLGQRIVVFNPAAEYTFGIRREQVLGAEYASLFPAALGDKVRADLARVAAGGAVSFENAITRPDGARAIVLWSMQAMVDRHGRSHGVAAVGQDATLRQRMEEALYGQLQWLRRLAAQIDAAPPSLDQLRAEIDRATAALRIHLDARMLPAKPIDRLTQREREVFSHLARGMTNAAIARTLGVSVRTIETHRSHVMGKLGLRGPRELIHYAVRSGLVPPQG